MHAVSCLQPHTIDFQMPVLGRKVISNVSVKDAFWQPRYVMDIMTVKTGLMKVIVSTLYTDDNYNPLSIHNQHSSQNNMRMIKSRCTRLVGYVAHLGEKKNAYRISVRNPDGKHCLEELGIGVR